MNEADVYLSIGSVGFERLVAAFYRRVRTDDVLGPLYPPDDFEAAEVRLRGFLIQRFGGPNDYSAARGHPRLRMRHAPFAIDPAAAERWLTLMSAAMREAEIAPDVAALLWPYFVSTATHMINRPGGSREEK
jgi:hemoglobin